MKVVTWRAQRLSLTQKFELANVKETLRLFQGRTSADSSAIRISMEGRDGVQGELATQRLQSFKLRKRLFLSLLTALSETPVACGRPKLRYRNVSSPICGIIFRWYSTKSHKAMRRII